MTARATDRDRRTAEELVLLSRRKDTGAVALRDAIAQALADERERCAKVAENAICRECKEEGRAWGTHYHCQKALEIAAAIRALGSKGDR